LIPHFDAPQRILNFIDSTDFLCYTHIHMRRICHVITKPELGGAQLSALNILSGLPKNKYEVSVVTSSKGLLFPEFKKLTSERIKTFFSPFLVRRVNPILDILALIHIWVIYIYNRFNIVHTHSSKAGIIGRWAALLAGVPVIVHTVHGWSFNDYQGVVKKNFFILLEKITAKFTARIICVSSRDTRTALKYKIAPYDKLVFIKYGIPLNVFKKTSTPLSQKRKELGITNNDPVVGMIACLKPQKSPLDYIKACIKIYEEMPDVNFLLVGDGALKDKCRELSSAGSLNGRFVFTGWRRDIPDILDVMDIMVLTSKWEGMPISVIEALSKGCPVVATDAGGTSELIRDRVNGYIVNPGEYEKISEHVIKLLKNPQLLKNMKQEAVLSIDDSFKVERMIEETESLYEMLA
jgi:glycosyltransferase involved in cell wall biosynthesis